MRASTLEKIGLSPNEAKCYLALMEEGSSSANELARAAGIHRVSVYDALAGLREKGLVSQIIKENKLLFEASNPKKIEELIENKEAEIKAVRETLPFMVAVFKRAKEKQEIHSFKGTAGIKTVLQDMLRSKTEILDFGAEYKIKEVLPYYYPLWEKQRREKKITMRIIANNKIRPTKIHLTKIRYVPAEFASSVSTYIFDGRIALIMWVEKPMAIVVEHKAVYVSYKNYFEYLWKIAKK